MLIVVVLSVVVVKVRVRARVMVRAPLLFLDSGRQFCYGYQAKATASRNIQIAKPWSTPLNPSTVSLFPHNPKHNPTWNLRDLFFSLSEEFASFLQLACAAYFEGFCRLMHMRQHFLRMRVILVILAVLDANPSSGNPVAFPAKYEGVTLSYVPREPYTP